MKISVLATHLNATTTLDAQSTASLLPAMTMVVPAPLPLQLFPPDILWNYLSRYESIRVSGKGENPNLGRVVIQR